MNPPRARKLLRFAALAIAALIILTLAGCLRVSNGTWYFKSADVPQGWPELTPVGEVEVKSYPPYRAAVVTDVDIPDQGMEPMFNVLFDHIKRNDIAMTAPVEMAYDTTTDTPRMSTMAFLYRTPDLGTTGHDGPVRVEDLPAQTYATIGVRGGYTPDTYRKGLTQLQAWLAENPQYLPTGQPRFLGYNAPFIPPFWRYGEVQIPVTATP